MVKSPVTNVPDERYADSVPERLARVETKVDALDQKVDELNDNFKAFVKTTTSPDIGFVSAGYLANAVASGMREDVATNKRLDEINVDHNNRITKLEDSETRRGYWLAGLFGSVLVDVVLHVTGIKP